MADVPIYREFAGQARLIRLLLWRIGDSTDIDRCISVAIQSSMLDKDDAEFLRECLAAEEQAREIGFDKIKTTSQTVARLRRCADKLNRADSA